jgi:hypothetical protein
MAQASPICPGEGFCRPTAAPASWFTASIAANLQMHNRQAIGNGRSAM